MKFTQLLAITALSAITIDSAFAQRRPAVRKSIHEKKHAERAAALEEFQLDKHDTHGAQNEPGKDVRPEDISKYHLATINRIDVLLRAGKITEAQGTEFKLAHTEVTNLIKGAKASDAMTKGKIASIRKDLDEINDDINAVVVEGDKGDNRTPHLNIKQNKFEEAIEFGVRSGRLSTGEASSLRRKLEKLVRLEERSKSGSGLSTREREKLHEEAAEIRRDLMKDLTD